MISASHNPYPDNGVKLFEPGGRKLRDETEQRIEPELHDDPRRRGPDRRAPTGRVGSRS